MQSKVIIAANIITLLVVAYVGFQVKGQKHDPRKRGITASGALQKAQKHETDGRYREASVWYNQAMRIGAKGIRSVANQGRHRVDALIIISHHEVPASLSKGLAPLREALAKEPPPNPAVGSLLRAAGLIASGQGDQAYRLLEAPNPDPMVELWRRWLASDPRIGSSDAASRNEALNAVLAARPEFAAAHYRRGRAILNGDDAKSAIEAFERAHSLGFGALASMGISQAYAHLGDWPAAEAALAKSLEQRPETAAALLHLAGTFLGSQRDDAAAKAYLAVYEIDQSHETLIKVMEGLQAAGRGIDSERLSRAPAAAKSASAHLLVARAKLCEALGKPVEARLALETLLALEEARRPSQEVLDWAKSRLESPDGPQQTQRDPVHRRPIDGR